VLRGAERIVVESQPVVVFEWGDRAAAPYGASKVDVHRFFSHCGLVLSHLQAFVDGGPPMDEAEFLNTTGFMFVGHAPSR